VLLAAAGAIAFVPRSNNSGSVDPLALAQQQLANCQALAARTTGAEHDRALKCMVDQTAIINRLAPGTVPTISSGPSAGAPILPSPGLTTPAPTGSVSPGPTNPASTTNPANPGAPPTTKTTNPGNGLPKSGCAAKPSTCGFPDATNTGVPAGTALTTIGNDYSISTAGAVITGKLINGCVEVHAANVTIRNSRIVGDGCFYAVRNFSTGLRLENDEITCGNSAGTGVTADNFTMVKSQVTGCENGFNVSGTVTVQDSWIHDLYIASGTHTDGAQFNQGAGSVNFTHNSIVLRDEANSAIIMWDEGNPQNHDVTITNNLFSGGGYTLYCPRNNTSNVQVTNNRFGSSGYAPMNGCTSGHVANASGNTLDANGAPLQPS
jgi:hypothetical protein